MGQDFGGLAAQNKGRDTPPAVRCHGNQVATVLRCGVENGSIGLLLLDLQHSAPNTQALGLAFGFEPTPVGANGPVIVNVSTGEYDMPIASCRGEYQPTESICNGIARSSPKAFAWIVAGVSRV